MSKPGYQHLLTYQQLEEIYNLTSQFCERFLPGRENLRIREQMVHAARSAKQCLVEGYEQESLKGYIKLTGVSRGSLKELLEDYKDFARNHQVEVWGKGDKRVKHMLAQRKQRKQGPKWTLPLIPFHPFNPLYPVNYMLNLVNMTTYLLDRQIDSLKDKFIKEGGWTETIFKKRLVYRQKQLGFTLVELLITLAIFVTIAAAGVVVWERQTAPDSISTSIPTTASTPSPTPTPTQPSQSDNVLSVLDLTGNREAHVGKRVRVQGRIAVHVFYSERPCAENDPVCDTTMGARLELWQPKTVSGAENFLLLFVKNQPYPCQKTAPATTYACPPYINNQIATIEGVWSKDQVPKQWVGSSDGSPPTPIKWEDRYFLNIE